MKKVTLFILTLIASYAQAQIAVGKEEVEGKGILDFDTEFKGIILPIVDLSDPAVIYSDGTFLMDKSDQKVKVYQNNEWLEISDVGSFEAQKNSDTDALISTAAQINNSEEVGGGFVIGDLDSNDQALSGAQGVLVLEASDQALILPRVPDPHINISSPVAGTMCYDTVSNSLAIFDGVVWSYWK